MKILLIEDDIQDVELLQEYLSEGAKRSCKMIHVNRLQDGLTKLKNENFDIILTDLGLPDGMGIETFNKVNVAAPNMPIIVLTGLDDEETGEDAVRNGAQDYLVKGDVDSKLLSRTLRYAIERKRVEKRLKESNSMKDLLLDVITHDLKNPCGVVNGLAEILYEKDPFNDAADAIMVSSERILNVIENATILAQASSGEQIVKQTLDLNEIIGDSIIDFKSSLQSSGMLIDYVPNGKILIRANPIISEVIKNYISNAIKYATAGMKIVINAKVLGGEVIVKVSDFGRVIPEESRGLIFERLYQMTNGKKRGRGLGLSIVKRIAEAHNGKVWVEPNKPNGNSFCFSLRVSI